MRYSTNIVERYFCEPIVLIFCVHHVQPKTLLDRFAQQEDSKPYLLLYQAADLWAKQCFLIPKQTSLTLLAEGLPLDPLLALSLFFTEKQPCVSRHPHARDPIIRSLYALAKKFAESERHIEDNYKQTLSNINGTYEEQLMKMRNELDELVPDTIRLGKLVDCTLEYNRKLKRRFSVLRDDDGDTSDSSVELPPQVVLTNPSSSSKNCGGGGGSGSGKVAMWMT